MAADFWYSSIVYSLSLRMSDECFGGPKQPCLCVGDERVWRFRESNFENLKSGFAKNYRQDSSFSACLPASQTFHLLLRSIILLSMLIWCLVFGCGLFEQHLFVRLGLKKVNDNALRSFE